jgi:HPt (histidine-containing phosphotransfer) domain-containing protein
LTGIDGRLAALRERFVTHAVAEIFAIRMALGQSDWSRLRDLTHGLSGRAGMFGFPALGEAAAALEEAIEADVAPAERRQLAEQLIASLDAAAQGRWNPLRVIAPHPFFLRRKCHQPRTRHRILICR